MQTSSLSSAGNFKIFEYMSMTSKSRTDRLGKAHEAMQYANRFTPTNIKFTPPDFSTCYSNQAPEMSEAEYEQAIIKQAQEDSANGRFYVSEGHNALLKSYVQCVSPNRINIYNESMKKTGGKMNAGFGFYDEYGSRVMDFSPDRNQWHFLQTEGEKQRAADYTKIYQQAWKEAEANKSAGQTSSLILDVRG